MSDIHKKVKVEWKDREREKRDGRKLRFPGQRMNRYTRIEPLFFFVFFLYIFLVIGPFWAISFCIRLSPSVLPFCLTLFNEIFFFHLFWANSKLNFLKKEKKKERDSLKSKWDRDGGITFLEPLHSALRFQILFVENWKRVCNLLDMREGGWYEISIRNKSFLSTWQRREERSLLVDCLRMRKRAEVHQTLNIFFFLSTYVRSLDPE